MVQTVGAALLAVLSVGVLPATAQVPAPSLGSQARTVFPGTTTVGKTSSPLSVTVVMTADGTAVAPALTTQGSVRGEFTAATGGSCAAGAVHAGDRCTMSVAFEPLYPGLRLGAVVVTNGAGQLLGETQLAGVAVGPLPVLKAGRIDTVAGDGDWIYRGDGYAATASQLFLPMGVAEDTAGNVYIADSNNNRIRVVSVLNANMYLVAGNGVPGYNGEGAAADVEFSSPAAIVLDGNDNLYVADSGNMCVRRIDAVTRLTSTVAGVCGVQGYSGDNGPATAAKLSLPEGLAMDAAGNLYIADTSNNVVRKVDMSTGTITTIAGNGRIGALGDGGAATKAELYSPWGITVATDGTLYIADLANHKVRKVTPAGIISTVAGDGVASYTGDGGLASNAGLNAPAAVALDPAGNLYIGDAGNNRVREVAAATGDITTLVGGNGTQFDGDTKSALQASLYGPYALHFDHQGNLFIADMFHNRIRRVSANGLLLKFDKIRVSKKSPTTQVGVENDGNADVHLGSAELTNSTLDPAQTTCGSAALSSGNSCLLGVQFAPTVVGSLVNGTINLPSDGPFSPVLVQLQGEVLTVNPTTVTLASSSNPALFGAPITLTASIASSDTKLGGTVDFLDGANVVCAAAAINGNTAVCTTSALALGSHTLTASYTGDSDNAAGVSTALTQVVRQPTTAALTASPNPAVVLNPVTLSVTVTGQAGTPEGTVTFADGGTPLGSAILHQGSATLTLAQLSAGTHTITASYAGDAADAPADAAPVSEVVNLATTVTTLGSSAASSTAGQTITLTATVNSSNGPTPTGSVAFLDGSTVLGTVVLNGAATASLTSNALSAGTHHIVAAYGGDTVSATSTSAALTETVQQIATTTTESVDVNPADAGQTITLSAAVSLAPGASADGPLSGTVTFSEGGVALGTGALDSNGKASLQTNRLAVGTHNIVASFDGSTNYAASASAALTETVAQTPTIASVSTSGSGLAGMPLKISALVTSAWGVPTGTVSFRDGTSVLGTGVLDARGVATWDTTALSAGNHALTAVYSGDANNAGTTAPAYQQTISKAAPTVILSGPTGTLNAGTQAVFAGFVNSGGVQPTGTLTLRDGSTTIATQALTTGATFSFNTTVLAVGTHTLSVIYGGDADNSTATSNAVQVVVQQGATATSLQVNANPEIVGNALTLTASVTSPSPNATGTMSFFDGTVLLGSSAVNATGTAVLSTSSLAFGSHTLTAAYSGDTNHGASTSAALSERIVQAVHLGVAPSANPSIAGAGLTLAIKAAGNAATPPSGMITVLDGTAPLGTVTLDANGNATLATSSLSVGSHAISVTYPGDDNYAAGTSTVLTETVVSATTQIALSAGTNPAMFGTPLSFRAVISSNGGVASGKVVFNDGANALGAAALDATGTAVFTTAALTPGIHAVVATYAGDGSAGAAASVPLQVVVKQTAAVSLNVSANPVPTLTAVTLTAQVVNAGQDVPTGGVTFTDGAAVLGSANVDATGRAVLIVPQLAAATHTLSATYAGDTTNFAATSAALNDVVNLRATSTSVTATVDPKNSSQVTLIAVVRWNGPVAPTGTVTFTAPGGTAGTVPVDATGVATLVINVGTTQQTMTVSYSGDAAYAASTSAVTPIAPDPAAQFSVSLQPAAITMSSGAHGTLQVAVNSRGTFADTLQLGCVGLPAYATCTFSHAQSSLAAGATVNVQLTVDTGTPLGAGPSVAEVRGTRPGVLLCFVPGALWTTVFLWRRRRTSKLPGLLAMAVAVALMLGASGCGSSMQMSKTPAGNYTFQVIARGQNTGIAESQTVTLTVTQ